MSTLREGRPDAGGTSAGPSRELPGAGDCRDWQGHVIVCGLGALGLRTVDQLRGTGARVVVLAEEPAPRYARILDGWGVPLIERGGHLSEPLYAAGIGGAACVICIESSDLGTLETVLLIRDLRPEVRIIAHLDNPAVARAVEEVTGSGSVLDIAALFAPSVVEASVRRRAHDIVLGGTHFVTAETVVTEPGTLRELYGSLVPLGVAVDGARDPVLCPGRDHRAEIGARVTLLGTRDEIEAAALSDRPSDIAVASRRRLNNLRRLIRNLPGWGDRALGIALMLALTLLVVTAVVLHLGYRDGGKHLSFLTALYFTIETISTVGFGDFSFSSQPVWMEVYGIVLILAGTTLLTTIFALLTNALVSRRIAQSLGQARIPGMRDHVVLVGLGAVGLRVLEGLIARGREVIVVERDEQNRYLNQVRDLGVPLVLGDATLGLTLDAVNLSRAASVAILTSNDLVNIETGLAVRDRLGERWTEVPVVVRVFDRGLGRRLEGSFGFRHVWSTTAIAAPWFTGAALGMDVLLSFYVGNHPFLLARLRIAPGGGLEGTAMSELGARLRVIAIGRGASGTLEHPPRRDTRFAAGDEAYLAGPDDELLRVLRREREGSAA